MRGGCLKSLRIALVSFGLLGLSAGPARPDPAGFVFLEVPAGARASAMAGAYVTQARGVEAAFWNPAGLASVEGVQITASHFEFLQQLRHAQFAVAGNLFGGGSAAALRAMYSEPIAERDVLGNQIGTFGAHDLEIALGHGRNLGGGLQAGGTVQIVRERIAEFSATTYAAGLGATWNPERWSRLRLGAALQNLGPAGRYDLEGARGEPVPLPAAFQLGTSYQVPVAGLELLGAVDGRFTRGRPGVGMIGLEARHGSGAALRAGLRANDPTTSYSAGIGYSTQGLRLDYAYVPYRLELGETHRFSVSAQF